MKNKEYKSVFRSKKRRFEARTNDAQGVEKPVYGRFGRKNRESPLGLSRKMMLRLANYSTSF